MPTEAEIRQWMRDERTQMRREEQDACDHRVSGTLKAGVVSCDQCGKSPLIAEHLMT